MNTMKTTEEAGPDEYMAEHGYRKPSRAERLVYGSFIQRETVPSIITGWLKRSVHRAVAPRASDPSIMLMPAPEQIRQIAITPEWESAITGEFAGDPSVKFGVRSIHVNGEEVGPFRYFGVSDFVNDLFFDSKCEVYGLPLLK